MKIQIPRGINVQIFWILLLLYPVFPVFAQNREGGGQKKQSREGSMNGRPVKSPLPEVRNGNIILGSPTANAITASIIPGKFGGEVFIEYAESGSRKKNKTHVYKSAQGEPVNIVMDKLVPNASYSYRLHHRLPGEKEFTQSGWSMFSTQKKYGDTFSFGVQGDSHPEREGKMFSPVLYLQTLDSVIRKKPDFYFLMGDDFSIDRLVENNRSEKGEIDHIYLRQRCWLGNKEGMPPLFLVNGNHEQAAKYLLDGSEKNPAVNAANSRKKYFPLPDPGPFYTGNRDTVEHIGYLKDYYSFEWGNALFVVIDPYWHSAVPVDNQPGSREKMNRKDPWAITIGDAQFQWLKNTLEQSKAKFKFVFSHHVLGTGRGGVELAGLYEWGGYDRDGTWQFEKFRPRWSMPIHQLMVKNKVTIFFQGHDHLFARQELDGIIYQAVPNPADDTYTAFNRDAYKSGVILPNSGYLNVTVNAVGVKVDYVRSYLQVGTQVNDEAKQSYSYTVGQ